MSTKSSPWWLASLSLLAFSPDAHALAKHVVVIVWDGMRPDFISEKTTPALYELSQRGTFFKHHHSAFVTSTEVNGTVFGTGMNPEHSGVIANIEYRPAIDPQRLIAIESTPTIRRGDEVTHGSYLLTKTVPEILRANDPSIRTAVAGSKPVAWLLDRSLSRGSAILPVLAEGETVPEAAKAGLMARLGEFPAIGKTKADRDAWTARALVEEFWRDAIPAYSHLWLAEPDFSQHATGPGSPTSLSAIAGSDQQLARVVKELERRHALEETDIIVVSDHGFSTINRNVDLAVDLSGAGLTTARAFTGPPAPGTVLVAGLGGAATLYVTGHDPKVIRQAVAFLQLQDYTGVIFTRDGIDGTFPLSLAKVASPEAPDILVTFRWSETSSAIGTPGSEPTEGNARKPGQGTHAGLSPYDLHNTLVAAGPDFRKKFADDLPTGNIDVAPTVLWILGVKPPQPMDGRVLTEALTIEGPPAGAAAKHRADGKFARPTGTWEQYLDYSEVNGVRYFDAGNGALKAK